MLVDLYGKPITNVTGTKYRKFYEQRIGKLSENEYNKVVDYIINLIDTNTKDNFFQPGWAAGSDWTGTDLQPIYEKACDYNDTDAGYVYGLLVKDVFINHISEEWIMHKTEMRGRDFEQNVYMKRG